MPQQSHLADCRAASSEPCDCELRRYMRLFWITLAIFAFQVAGGWLSGSLAIFSDSAHVATDGAGALISVYVAKAVLQQQLSKAEESAKRRFWMRISAAILLLSLLWICKEAYERYMDPKPVDGWIMIIVAVVGWFGNEWQHRLILHEHNETADIQKRHVEGDLYSSRAVIIGGAIIVIGSLLGHDWRIVDPLFSAGIALFVGLRTAETVFGKSEHDHHGHHHSH